MKRFLTNSIFFILLLFVCLISICEIKISDKKIIEISCETAYEKIAWNLILLNTDSQRISNSYVFIGPSTTMNGINDSLLSTKGFKSINFGVNHSGADLDYYFTKKLLLLNPKKIFIQRFPTNIGIFHPMMPLLMSPCDFIFNFKQITIPFVFNYIPKRFYFVIKSLVTFGNQKTKNYLVKKYGRRPSGLSHMIMSPEQDIKLINEKRFLRLSNKIESIGENGIKKSNHFYKNIWRGILSFFLFGNGESVKKLTIELCNQKNINLTEIYIPNYADAIFDSKYIDTNYFSRPISIKNKCLYVKNVSFLANYTYWGDNDHLNTKGSNIFTSSIYFYLLKQ